MQELVEKLDEVEIKLRQLIQENRRLQRLNEDLRDNIVVLQQELKEKEAENLRLTTEIQALDQSETKGEAPVVEGIKNSKSIKRQIERYVQKIDEFIELLENS